MLTKHLDGKNLLFCGMCSYKTTVSKYLVRHQLVNHSNEQLQCDKCEFQSVFQRKMSEHIKVVHEGVERLDRKKGVQFSCDIRDYLTLRQESLKQHEGVL